MSTWKAKPAYQEMFWSDFFSSTMTMSDDAAHAYLFLLGRAWENGGYLKADDDFLRRASRMKPQRWNRCKMEVLERFEVAKDGRLFHPRILEDLERVNQKRESQKRNANSRWRKKANENKESDDANASNRQCPPAPTPIESESDRDSESKSLPEESDTNVARQSGAPSRADYRFQGRVIRLKADDYERWRDIYHAAFEDFDACLQSADDWIAKQDENKRKGWFFVVSGMLRKRHEAELKARARKAEVSECML